MHIAEAARLTGATVKAIRHYERIGLIDPERMENGYRSFDERQLRVIVEIRELSASGIAPNRAAPFVECLDAGHEHSANRGMKQKENAVTDYSMLPEGLPVPQDDGAADHLVGLPMPALSLPTSDGRTVTLSELGKGRSILYLYPLTGRPGTDLPAGWDAIPGARGCSTEACDFRDHFEQLRAAGVQRVFGVSSQDVAYQGEVVDRLRLPFSMISDQSFALAEALRLPTFAAAGHERLYSRLTLVVLDGFIEHVFYPIFPPNTHAQQVLGWLSESS